MTLSQPYHLIEHGLIQNSNDFFFACLCEYRLVNQIHVFTSYSFFLHSSFFSEKLSVLPRMYPLSKSDILGMFSLSFLMILFSFSDIYSLPSVWYTLPKKERFYESN
nr:MAG TPA: hypothetical protein [Caudoviricetes sp.]